MKLFLIILLAAVDVALGAAKCTAAPQTQCFSCFEKGMCTLAGADVTAGDKCGKGEACMALSGTATCRPWNETDCNCAGKSTGCDPFSGVPIYCIKNAGVYPRTPCLDPKICQAGQCVDPPTPVIDCLGKDAGFFVSRNNCSRGAFCFSQTLVEPYDCPIIQYFNQRNGECEAFPTNPCAGCNGDCPILGDCANYVVCAGGNIADDSESCPPDTFFDPDTKVCVAKEPQTCLDYKKCRPPPITTTTSSIATTTSTTPSTPITTSVSSSSTSTATSTSTTSTTSTTIPPVDTTTTTSTTSTHPTTTTPPTTSTTTPPTTSTTTPPTTSTTTPSTTSTTTPTTTSTTTPTTTSTTTPPTTSTTTPPTTSTTTPPTTSTTTPPTTSTSTATTTKSTTTATVRPPKCTAADVNKRFAHETDCKKYYTCRLISGTNYDYVVATCISTYVFNPASKYCELPANVPGCVVTAGRAQSWFRNLKRIWK